MRGLGGGVDGGAGDDRRDERSGREAAPDLLGDDDELLEAIARAAELLRDMQAEPAQVRDLGPKFGQRFLGSIEQGASRGSGSFLLQEVADGVGERFVVLGNGDRHTGEYGRVR